MHDPDSKVNALQLDEGKRFIDLAHELKSPYIRVFGDKFVTGEAREATLARVVAGLQNLGQHARGSGVTVLIESHGDFFDSPTLKKVLETVNLPTVALLLAISMAGAWLVRHQGFHILRRIQDELAMGRLPAADLVDGALVLAGGILLLTPGFFTDFVGLFFLIPPTRAFIKQFLGLWLQARLTRGTTVVVRRF